MADVVEVALAVVDGAAVEDGVILPLETRQGRTTVTNEEDEAPARDVAMVTVTEPVVSEREGVGEVDAADDELDDVWARAATRRRKRRRAMRGGDIGRRDGLRVDSKGRRGWSAAKQYIAQKHDAVYPHLAFSRLVNQSAQSVQAASRVLSESARPWRPLRRCRRQ